VIQAKQGKDKITHATPIEQQEQREGDLKNEEKPIQITMIPSQI
jgi:hypothetical protein